MILKAVLLPCEQERIQIMHSLASTRPVVARSSEDELQHGDKPNVHMVQPQQPPGVQQLPQASAPPLPAS